VAAGDSLAVDATLAGDEPAPAIYPTPATEAPQPALPISHAQDEAMKSSTDAASENE
jgi:hypothetical protein